MRVATKSAGELMHLNSNMQRAGIIGGIALLTVFGLIAVTHRTETAEPLPAAMNTSSYRNPEPVSRNVTPVVYSASPFGGDASPAAERSAVTQPVVQRYVAPPRRPVAQRSTSSRSRRPRVVVHRRKFSHSAAIVGGSAAGGAAIGALAGGGKGAAIGALVGGGGGLAYDRLTHKKKRVVRR